MAIKFLLEVDEKGAVRAVREFKGELNSLEPAGKKAAAGTDLVSKNFLSLKNMLIGGGVLVALNRLGAAHSAITAAAGQQEEATLRLTSTLRLNNQGTAQNLRVLEAQASAYQKVTRFSDELITSAQSQLMAIGQLNTQGVMKLTPALLDFASAMQIDVVQAAEMFGKVLDGSVNMLGRYGIQVDMSKDATGRLNDMLTKVNEKFAGQSQIKGYTTSMMQFKNALGEVSEELGFLITGKEGGLLGALARAFFSIAEGMAKTREEAALMKGIVPQGWDINGAALVRTYTPQQIAAARAGQSYAEAEMAGIVYTGTPPAPPGAPIKQNWGATPFSQFGATGQFMTFGGLNRDLGGGRFPGMTPDLVEKFAEEDAEIAKELADALEKIDREMTQKAEDMFYKRQADMERFGNMWGSIMYNMYSDSALTFKNIGAAFEDMAKQIAMRAGMMAVFNIATGASAGTGIWKSVKEMLGFAGGGYTGYGNPNAVAGSVHRGEYVFDAGTVGQYGPSFFDRLAGVLKKGGGYTDSSHNTFNLSGVNSGISLEELAQKITRAKRHRLIA